MSTHGKDTDRVARVGKGSRLFTMLLSAEERSDLEARASYRRISAAQYVRMALAAVAAVGGPEEVQKPKGKKK